MTRIAFTSCMRASLYGQRRQPQWEEVAKSDPDYLLLLGDQVYMDYGVGSLKRDFLMWPRKADAKTFEAQLRMRYEYQWEESNFKALIARLRGRLFATWDDHDFAWDGAVGARLPDGGWRQRWRGVVDAERKGISRRLFHEYLDCSTNRPEIYCFHDIQLARVIVLDNRFHATVAGPNGRLLGDEQWAFLEASIGGHDKPYTLLCGGLTLTQGTECWKKYPGEYRRLAELIRRHHSESNRVLFLAGDIHKTRLLSPDDSRPCYQVVASGMAINAWGLPLWFDNLCNWGLLKLRDDAVLVSLRDTVLAALGNRRRWASYCIDRRTWQMVPCAELR